MSVHLWIQFTYVSAEFRWPGSAPPAEFLSIYCQISSLQLGGKSRILWQDWLLMIRRDQFSIWSAGSWILLLLPDAPLSLPPVHCANCGNVVRFLKQKAFVVPPPSSLRCSNQNNQNHQQQTKSWWARIVSTILKLKLEKVENIMTQNHLKIF